MSQFQPLSHQRNQEYEQPIQPQSGGWPSPDSFASRNNWQLQQPGVYVHLPQDLRASLPSKKPKKSRRGLLFALLLALVLIPVAWIAVTSLTSSRGQDTIQHHLPAKRPFIDAKVQHQIALGKPIIINNTWTLTVSSVSTSHGDSVDIPRPQDIYLIIELALRNGSTKVQNVSPAVMFILKDDSSHQYNSQTVGFGAQPEGNVPPGSSLRGLLVYEVPASQHQFVFEFRPSTTANNWTAWNLTI
jgi:Domain of unknown function (DUF4352)